MSMERFSGIRRVLRIRNSRRDLDDELAFHFERTTEHLMARGMLEPQAREEAQRRFGDERRYRRELEQIDRRAAMGRRWAEWWEVVASSLRYALRRMRHSPGFSLGVILTFALGIGANATMFGIIDQLLLRPPAHVVDAERVRRLMVDRLIPHVGTRETVDVLTYPDYLDFTHAHAFTAVAAFVGHFPITVGRGAEARQIDASLVTGKFFSLLGARPALGRFFGPDEDRPGAPGVAVIGYGMWQREFGGDREVLGKTLDFGYGPYTIIGVAPRGFIGVDLEAVDVWLPFLTAASQTNPYCIETRNCNWLRAVARLAPGVSPQAAGAEATGIYRAAWAEHHDKNRIDPEARVVAAPLIAARGPLASDEAKVAKWLAGISLIVLLVACANIANLLLARATRQQREIGVRLALGSSRGWVLGQVLTESLLLALLGGAAALLLTRWGGAAMRSVLLPGITWEEPGLELRITGVVLALALLAGLIAGSIPAVQLSRSDLVEILKSSSRTTSTPASRIRGALTVLQAAFSVVLLVGAGLFVRSLHRVNSLDLGLDPEGVLLVEPVFQPGGSEQQEAEFFGRATEWVSALRGVDFAAASAGVPFRSARAVRIRVPGLDSIPRLNTGGPYISAVTPDYFDVLSLDILRGRGIQPRDNTGGAPRIIVVNETMARLLWPGQEALGKCLLIGGKDSDSPPPCAEVVGVVEDAHRQALIEEATMQYYVPLAQEVVNAAPDALLVRVRDDAERVIPTLQRELLALHPPPRYANVQPLRERIDPQARSWRLGATMFSAFGLLALLVAGIGLYSVLAFSVAQRAFELGVRSALGATRERLMRLVFGQAMRLVGIGIVLGLLAALLLGPRVSPLLFETSPRDPVIFAVVAIMLLLVSVLASSLPAWRATRVDPSVALRAE